MLLIKWCLTESLEALHDSKRREHTDKHESQNQGSDDIVTLTHPTACSCSFGDQKSPWGLQPVRMWPSFNSLDILVNTVYYGVVTHLKGLSSLTLTFLL
jgi:hypothetical protein